VTKYLLILLFYVLSTHSMMCADIPDYESHTIIHDGLKRTYLVHFPKNMDKKSRRPLIIALHGGLGNGKRMMELTSYKFNELSDKENFIVVYPDGIGKNWNDGRKNMPGRYKAHNRNIDDVGFISTLIDTMVNYYNVDSTRVFVTGMSNGAIMSQRLAIELSDKIAAAAPVCGNIPEDLESTPKNAVAMMIINGTKDPLVPYDGGYVHFGKKKLGKVCSTDESIKFWVKHNQVKTDPVTTKIENINISDSCNIEKTTYFTPCNCKNVVLISVKNGGHTWPGGKQYLGKKLIGNTNRDIDACQVIWDFFNVQFVSLYD